MSDIFILAPDPSGAVCDCTQLATVCASCSACQCSCAAIMPPCVFGGVPYTDYATAAASIDAFASSCNQGGGADFIDGIPLSQAAGLNKGTADFNGTTFNTASSFSAAIAYMNAGYSHIFSLNMKAASVLTLVVHPSYVGGGSSITASVDVVLCDGTAVFSVSRTDAAANFIATYNIPITDEDEYIVKVKVLTADTIAFSMFLNTTATSDKVFTINPVIALYTNPSDPLVPYQLEACPKLLLPILTESSGAAYATVADAQADIDDFTSNCVGYCETFDTFTATNGGTMLSLNGVFTHTFVSVVGQIGMSMWGSVNLLSGSILSVSYNISTSGSPAPTAGTSSTILSVWDQDGVLVSQTPVLWPTSSGTIMVSIARNGKYLIACAAFGATPTPSVLLGVGGSFTASSNMVLSVNPVQALYANGTNCPSRLDCTP